MSEFFIKAYVRLVARGEEGQGMLEYALVISFVALVAIAGVTVFGLKVGNLFNEAGNQLVK